MPPVKSPAPGRKPKGGNRGAQPRPARPYHRHLLALAALITLTLLAYSNSFQAGFVLDNQGLLNDPRIREVTSENIALIFHRSYWWPAGEAGLYRPFTTLSYLFNYAVLGGRNQPAGYHAVNLILHLGNVLLAYALALRLIRRFWPPVFIAALWAVHPALTESVTNIVGRADLLAAMGVLSGFLMYLKGRESVGLPRVAWLTGVAGATTIGAFSKESAVAILPLLVLYEMVWWNERPNRRPMIFGWLAALAPIALMLYCRFAVLSASPSAEFPFTDNPIVAADWWTGRLTAVKVMARYLWLTVWPVNLSCDYSYNQIPLAHGAPADWLAYAAVLAAAVLVVVLYRWNRTCFFLACFALVNFLPASNLLFPIGTIMADRLLYLPALGLLACLVMAVYGAAQRPKLRMPATAVLCVLTAGFAVRTRIRNLDWQTNLTIATADVRVSPASFKLHRLLASSLFESDPSRSNLDQVIQEQEKSLAILDSLPPARSSSEAYRLAGYYYLLKGEHYPAQRAAANQRALQSLLRSISIDQASQAAFRSTSDPQPSTLRDGDSQAYFLLSVAYLRSGDPDKAYQAIDTARDLDPLNPQVYRQLSGVLIGEHRNQEAEVAMAQEDAITSLEAARWQDAADLSARVIESASAAYPAAFFLNAMANLHLGNLDQAEKSARQAIRLDSRHRNPRTGYVLGLVLAEKHDFKQAAELLSEYLTVAPSAPDTEAVQEQLGNIRKSAARR